MKKFKKRLKRLKKVAVLMALTMLFNICFPTVSMALTSGPASPEFSSFEPVSTTDMVDPFTGNFTYNLPVLNIPGPDGGGYAMSLSYHSGVTPEEEASWVGLGWTLNAGAINRGKVGLADDFNGVTVHRYNKSTPNTTTSVTVDGALEYASNDQPDEEPDVETENATLKEFVESFDVGYGEYNDGTPSADLTFTATSTVRYNNYQGFTRTNGYGVGFKGMASLNMTRSGGQSTFGISVNPLLILQKAFNSRIQKLTDKKNNSDTDGQPKLDKKLGRTARLSKLVNNKLTNDDRTKRITIARVIQIPSISPSNINTFPGFSVARTVGRSYNFSGSIEANPAGPIGIEIGYSGNTNFQFSIPVSDMQAYGYMHSPRWFDYYSDVLKEVKSPFVEGPNAGDNGDSKIIADYFIERESSFNKHDKYMGVPFNTADQFIVSGEGVAGGFRMHQEKVGHYYPTPTTNKQLIRQIGVEFGIGQTIQVGLDVGVGFQRTQVGNWKQSRRENIDASLEFEVGPYATFPRYNNDMGGSLRYTVDDGEVHSAYFDGNKKLQVAGSLEPSAALPENQGRSSVILYSTYDGSGNIYWPYQDVNGFSVNPEALDKMPSTNALRDIKPKDGIAEIATISPSGTRHTYGLPVYARNEENLTYTHVGSDGKPLKDDGVVHSVVAMEVNNDPLANYTVNGQGIDEPYATAYLLTQITGPNYVDVDDDGPSDRDYGAWTRFSYRKKHGGNTSNNDDWYHYRAPYKGLFYDKGKINNHYDQTVSVTRGVKEVCYLKAVETKTHVAFFVTNDVIGDDFNDIVEQLTDDVPTQNLIKSYLNGSGELRYDGMGAINPESGVSDLDGAANWQSPDATGPDAAKKLEKLERIVLFSKERLNNPLTTTHFEYSYELCQGVYNSVVNANDASIVPGIDYSKSGKLTLKKVWTESEGVVRSRIAPYQFEYNYFNDYQSKIQTNYPDLTNGYTDLLENPHYKPYLLDAWGNYEDINVAKEQRDHLRSWMSQREDPTNFDPAAWHLKRIILPSGGEIHIQYEEKDYTHVQDKEAMTMVSLSETEPYVNKMKYDENQYFINLEDLRLTNSSDIEEYYKQLVDYYYSFTSTSNKIAALSDYVVNLDEDGVLPNATNTQLYFQFLYSYWDEFTPSIHPTPHNDFALSDVINGYCAVWEIGKVGDAIYFKLGGKKKNKYNVPRRLCRETLLTNGGTGLARNHHLETDYNLVDYDVTMAAYTGLVPDNGDLSDEKDAYKAIKNKLKDHEVKENLFKYGLVALKVKNPRKGKPDVCADLSPVHSYMKLPVYHAKRGGGVRVKRLLTYNQGIESGEEAVYGTEYIYKMEDGSSSGVATFEPQGNRIENPKVEVLPRIKQKLFNKLLSGRDIKYQEGPIGENLYPSPAVVHERVIMRNIHSGKSAPGFVVNEYYTCREHPTVEFRSTEIHTKPNKQTEHYRKGKLSLPLGLFNYKKDNAWVTQGYEFKINDMHGKMKSTKTYGGSIDPLYPTVSSLNNSLLASTTYEYSDMDSVHTGLYMNSERHFMANYAFRPGEEEDITMYMGSVEDRTIDFSLELDLNISIQVPPVFYLGFSPSISMNETQLSQHVTCTVIRRNSLLKKVTTYAEGIESTTENLAYDIYTGNPVITKTVDQYEAAGPAVLDADNLAGASGTEDHAYYTFNIPASWVYPEMGQKAVDLSKLNFLSSNAGNVVTYMSNPLDKFSPVSTFTGTWNPLDPGSELENVISASAVEYRNNRFNDSFNDITNSTTINMNDVKNEYDMIDGLDDFDAGDLAYMNKFFYPVATYVYLDEIVSANATTSYEGGMVQGFTFFDWDEAGIPALNNDLTGWKFASQITKYSPHGQPLEEIDVLEIPSAVRFGYGKLLPTIIGANTSYETMQFHDFEYGDDFATNSDEAHTGKKSVNYAALNFGLIPVVEDLKLTERLYEKGGHFKVWLKSVTTAGENDGTPKINIEGNPYNLKKVARVGDWTLYQVYIKDWGAMTIDQNFSIKLDYPLLSGTEQLFIDDVCFNPLEAAVNCTVYDLASFRVVAQLGDQHFAKIYEYNYEGQLIRTIVETEKGRKTLMEQEYNVPRIER